jgi:hypothetical protein
MYAWLAPERLDGPLFIFDIQQLIQAMSVFSESEYSNSNEFDHILVIYGDHKGKGKAIPVTGREGP